MNSPPGPSRSASITEGASLVALGLLVMAVTLSPVTDYDLFLHLKTGAIILETGHVPQVDDYSAVARGRPFVAHEWLSEVAFRTIERGIGGTALQAFPCLAVMVGLAIAALLYGAARRLGASPVLAVPMLAFVMVLAAARLTVRPHLFSYSMLAAFLLLLAGRRAGRRIRWWAFMLLQIAWANLHGSFLLGPAIVGLAAIGEAIERRDEARRLGILAAALLFACVVNPYGLRLLSFPLQLTQSGFMKEIYEWRPPFASSYAGTYMARSYVAWIALGTAVLVSGLIAARRRRTLPPAGLFPLLLFVVFLALSLRMNRAVTDFALVTLPGLAGWLTWLAGPRLDDPRVRLPVIMGTSVALVGLASWFMLNGYPFRPGDSRPFGLGISGNTPILAADYLEANGVRGNVFNTYGIGPYLIYRLYPAIRVAMDSRNDVYGEALYGEYKKALEDAATLGALLRRIEASAVVMDWVGGKNLRTARLLPTVGPWRPVYFDDVAIIYMTPDGSRRDLVARDGYSLLDPARYRPGGFRPEQAPEALEEAERAKRSSRGALIARVMRIDALCALGRRDEAFEEEARVLASNPQLPDIYVFLGDIRLSLGDREGAAARYRRALDLSPGWSRALEGLRAAGASVANLAPLRETREP
jgi:tetratricopeptide (TPR) repeat protein